MKQAENSLKCKALLIKITVKWQQIFFSGSIWISSDVIDNSTFSFITRRRSYSLLETKANCQTNSLDGFLRFLVSISEKMIGLCSFENVSFVIANQYTNCHAYRLLITQLTQSSSITPGVHAMDGFILQ